MGRATQTIKGPRLGARCAQDFAPGEDVPRTQSGPTERQCSNPGLALGADLAVNALARSGPVGCNGTLRDFGP